LSAIAPIAVWGIVWFVLARWKQPSTQGTWYCWQAQSIASVAFFAVSVFVARREQPALSLTLFFPYFITSLVLVTVALLLQIRMLLPMDL
jgi:hypothetical protein